ncbi:MAG: hypothetical protein ABI083_00385 [Lapillicoccus sp.]
MTASSSRVLPHLPPCSEGDPELAKHTALLDAAVSYLVAHPRASLAQIAAAAGIGRTTLFKLFATRDDLEHAVAVRALAVCQAAVDEADDDRAPDGGLRALVTALLPIGPQLNFIWRTPSLDVDDEVHRLYLSLDASLIAVLARARAAGVLRDRPDWWLGQSLHALVYVAWESVQSGHLARLDAPDLVLDTMLTGVGEPSPTTTSRSVR